MNTTLSPLRLHSSCMARKLLPCAAILLCLPAPLFAQSASQPEASVQAMPANSVFDGDYITIGAGAAIGPSYDGSDETIVFPIGALMGSYGGIEFQARGPGLNVDIIPDTKDAKFDLIAGPSFRVRSDRVDLGDIKNAQVEALGKRKTAIELGGELGFQVNRVLHPYDSLTLGLEARWDVAGAHKGRLIQPRVTYFSPLSQGIIASLSISAEHMDNNYADYYFSIDAPGSIASGLSPYNAGSGWKAAGSNLLLAVDLDGNALNGGWGVFFNGGYSRILGDAAKSPIVADVGSRNQWIGMAGIGYTF